MSDRPAGPVAYTDGGCVGNPGPGGWGVHVEYPDGRVIELGGGELQTTNNRMELRAAIEAARAVAGWPSATIIADSQYVLRGITQWVAGWKRKDWITTTGEPVLNRDLWEELDAVATDRLTWEWAKGHSGVPGNERCDAIASWFSASVRPLGRKAGARRPGPSAARVRTSVPPTRPAIQPASRARPPARDLIQEEQEDIPFERSRRPSSVSYISLVDGIPARHSTWGDCELRVKGVKGARFKKVRSPTEAQEVFATWGVTAHDLFGV
jgi:ribonuclease HI